MLERAIFIGTDGSLGFIQGKTYRVGVYIHGNRIYVADIPYDTICAMNKNWKFIGIGV